jgi:hypothetical protein
MSDRSSPARIIRSAALAILACALVSGCDDGSELEAAMEDGDAARAVVSPEQQKFRSDVIASVAFFSPDMAAQTRQRYNAIDAGVDSRAMREAGGEKRVRSELRAAEAYHYAHKLDGCVADLFDLKSEPGQRRLLERLAASRHGAEMIAEAKRLDPEGYELDLYPFGKRPNQAQRVAAAYQTLSVRWEAVAYREGNEAAVKIFARTIQHLAAMSDGKCVPDPKLQPLLDSDPT